MAGAGAIMGPLPVPGLVTGIGEGATGIGVGVMISGAGVAVEATVGGTVGTTIVAIGLDCSCTTVAYCVGSAMTVAGGSVGGGAAVACGDERGVGVSAATWPVRSTVDVITAPNMRAGKRADIFTIVVFRPCADSLVRWSG